MSQKPEFIQLEANDDVTNIRDRMAFMRGRRVLIIWPEEGTTLTRKLDLVLIQREAVRQAIRLALVTHDPQVIQHAAELNISTFETIGASERGRWRRGRSKVFTTRWQRPEDEPEPAVAAAETRRARRRRDRDEDAEPRSGGLVRAGVVVVVLVALGAVGFVLVPSATVTIAPARAQVSTSAEIAADPAAPTVDIENRVIPAVTLRVEIDDTGTIPTTGREQLADVLAGGSVVFINQTDAAVEIPAGTTVSTSAGTPILFRTTAAATVPAQVGGQVEVPVEALPGSGGETGNVDVGLINTIVGDLAAQVTVRNLAPTYGGESRTRAIVTQEDADRLLAILRQQLQSRAYVGMEMQVTATQTIILETIRIAEEREDWKTWSASVGDATDSLTLTMRARVEAMAIDEATAQQVALALLTAEIPPGRALIPDSVVYTCCTVSSVDSAGRALFSMSGTGTVASRVNTALLQERLAGRSLADARRYLLSEVDLADGTDPQIVVSPDVFGILPLLPMRIAVQIAAEG